MYVSMLPNSHRYSLYDIVKPKSVCLASADSHDEICEFQLCWVKSETAAPLLFYNTFLWSSTIPTSLQTYTPWLGFCVLVISSLGDRDGCMTWCSEKPWCGRKRLLVASMHTPKEKGIILFHKYYCLNIPTETQSWCSKKKMFFHQIIYSAHLVCWNTCQFYFENSFLKKRC